MVSDPQADPALWFAMHISPRKTVAKQCGDGHDLVTTKWYNDTHDTFSNHSRFHGSSLHHSQPYGSWLQICLCMICLCILLIPLTKNNINNTTNTTNTNTTNICHMYVFVFNVSGIEMTLIVDDEASILRVKWVGYETSSSPKSQLHRKASTGKRDSDCTCSAGQLKYSENEVLGKTSLRVRCKQNSVQHPTIEPVHVSGVQLMFFFFCGVRRKRLWVLFHSQEYICNYIIL